MCVLGAGVPLLQHGLLCAQVRHFISQQANLPLVVIKSLQLPLVNLHLLMCGSQTGTQTHFTSRDENTLYIAFENGYITAVFDCITHSAFSCNISSSVASRVVADLLFVSSSSCWASTNLLKQKKSENLIIYFMYFSMLFRWKGITGNKMCKQPLYTSPCPWTCIHNVLNEPYMRR